MSKGSTLARNPVSLMVLAGLLILLAGCGPKSAKNRYKETTEAFVGSVIQEGKPITVPDGARLDLVHDETYSRFGIPLKADGTFTIGWMPTGKYSVELVWLKGGTSLARHSVKDGLTIEKDKSDYQVELGKGWKP